MKSNFRKVLLLLMLALTAALLTACYQDVDPWPVSVPPVTEAAPTAVPARVVDATLVPRTTATPVAQPAAPVAQPAAPVQTADDFWSSDPTEIPGGDEAPGLNG